MDDSRHVSHDGQFALLKQRRFLPFFLTQLLGAFNDNLYKNALIALLAFVATGAVGSGGALINLAAGLFILPYFLFSALAGQVADKYEKAGLLRRIKAAEIAIMALGSVAFFMGSVPLLMLVLFLMGTQSTFFGPIKYGILPQHLAEHELVGGNGLVELGTFLAILCGTIGGTLIITSGDPTEPWLLAAVLLLVAVAGFVSSRGIPEALPADPSLTLRFNPLTETIKLLRETLAERVIFQSILAISWFWFLGATYLAQLPLYSRDVLGGNVGVYTLLLATFSVGIACGSALCERLSHGRVEIGLVPFGAIGITLFGLDLVFTTPDTPLANPGLGSFLSSLVGWHVLIDLALIGLFGGFYIVPLYALIQRDAASERLSRTIAANNIVNALLMVLSALVVIVMLRFGLDVVDVFLFLALANAVVAIYIFRQVPIFFMHFLTWLLIHSLYRVRKQGLQQIPEEGAALLVCNHVSFVDALIIGGCLKRQVRFVMHHSIFRIPVLNFVFRTARAIPIAGRRENEQMYEQAFAEVSAALSAGELVCLFPEGKLTRDGEMNLFRPGLLRMLESNPVPVVPMALRNLWGSLFSHEGGRAVLKVPQRLFARIGLVVGEPIAAQDVTLEGLQRDVLALRGARR